MKCNLTRTHSWNLKGLLCKIHNNNEDDDDDDGGGGGGGSSSSSSSSNNNNNNLFSIPVIHQSGYRTCQ